MKLRSNTNACVLVLLACGALAACGTSESASTAQAGAQGGAPEPAPSGADATGARSGATATGTIVHSGDQAPARPGQSASGEWLGGPAGTLVIYFDYDRSAIRQEYGDILQAHGAWLAANPGSNLRLEGHADERGTAEYNLALGSRRAYAVAQALGALGADDGQWSTVSFGEERPADSGANEGAWSRNRRVEFVYD